MTEVDRLRLFVAIDIPSDLLKRLDHAVGPLKQRFPSARWAPIANQHVTLKFLGWTAVDRLDELSFRCEEVAKAHAPAALSLGGVGTFPGGRRMRVVWVGLEDPDGLTARVAAALDEALEPLGFEPEKRGYTPHLTLARFKTPQKLDEPLELPGNASEPFELTELVLYRSHLSPKGPRYEALNRFALEGGRAEDPRGPVENPP